MIAGYFNRPSISPQYALLFATSFCDVSFDCCTATDDLLSPFA